MRKRIIMISLICILSAAVIMIISAVGRGRKPYKDLEAVQIVSAAVQLSPPDRTIQITEIRELADLLKDVVIYNEDNSYTEYSGQAVIFTLVMADGTQTDIIAYNPFLVIDGVGYKTKYEPCEALNHYANMLLEQAEADTMWDRIPILEEKAQSVGVVAIWTERSHQRLTEPKFQWKITSPTLDADLDTSMEQTIQ